jgi:hypothetical protein
MVFAGFDAETMVDVEESPLIAIYGFKVIVSSMYTPGYTRTVYVLVAVASVILSTAALIDVKFVLLPTSPTVTKLSINNGGVYDAVVANDALITLLAQLLVPISVPVNEPLKLPVLICSDDDTTPLGNISGAKDADVANDAVVLLEELIENDADVANEDVPVNAPINELADTVVANIEPVTIKPDGNDTDPVKNDAVCANEAVPNNEPVIPPVEVIDPVISVPLSLILNIDTD